MFAPRVLGPTYRSSCFFLPRSRNHRAGTGEQRTLSAGSLTYVDARMQQCWDKRRCRSSRRRKRQLHPTWNQREFARLLLSFLRSPLRRDRKEIEIERRYKSSMNFSEFTARKALIGIANNSRNTSEFLPDRVFLKLSRLISYLKK